MLNIVIFGAPGSGKGTQSELLIEKYGLEHISTGEVLRKEIDERSELGVIADSYISKGRLVPDELIINVLSKLLDAQHSRAGVIFDGFPRTINQGIALDEMLKERNSELSIVLNLKVDEEELIDRLLKRGQVSGRSDDNMETITSRLQVYKEQTAPLISFYKEEGKLVDVEGGNHSIEDVFNEIDLAVSKVYRKAMAC